LAGLVDQGEPIPVPELKVTRELFGRGRLALMLSVVVIELAIFFAAMLTPVDPATQKDLLNQANKLLVVAKNPNLGEVFVLIFANNAGVALLEMVPVLGGGLFVYSIFMTGQVIKAIAASYSLPGPLFGLILFLFPFAMVELAAYAIAVGSGTMLIVAWSKRRLRREMRVFVIEGTIIIVVLVIAAAMETATIVSPVLGFGLWLPTALGIVALVITSRKRSP